MSSLYAHDFHVSQRIYTDCIHGHCPIWRLCDYQLTTIRSYCVCRAPSTSGQLAISHSGKIHPGNKYISSCHTFVTYHYKTLDTNCTIRDRIKCISVSARFAKVSFLFHALYSPAGVKVNRTIINTAK